MATEHRIQLTGPELDERLAQVLTNEEDIGQEQQTRETIDEGMQEQLGALSTRMDAQDTTNEQVATDIENLQKAIGTGGSVDDKIAAAVGAEATAREAADTALGGRITTLEAAVCTGGSVDERIATEATARADADTALGNRMTTLEGSVDDRLDQQDAAIGLLDGHKLEVVDVLPTDASPAVTPESDTIYRLVITDSETGDVSYEDYMYNEDDLTTPKKIANYPLPGVDEEPTPGSRNLVESGGIANYTKKNTVEEITLNVADLDVAGYITDKNMQVIGKLMNNGAVEWLVKNSREIQVDTHLENLDASVGDAIKEISVGDEDEGETVANYITDKNNYVIAEITKEGAIETLVKNSKEKAVDDFLSYVSSEIPDIDSDIIKYLTDKNGTVIATINNVGDTEFKAGGGFNGEITKSQNISFDAIKVLTDNKGAVIGWITNDGKVHVVELEAEKLSVNDNTDIGVPSEVLTFLGIISSGTSNHNFVSNKSYNLLLNNKGVYIKDGVGLSGLYPTISIQDDDALDIQIPESYVPSADENTEPSSSTRGGFASLLWPILKALNVKHAGEINGKLTCGVATEGQRIGLTKLYSLSDDFNGELNMCGKMIKALVERDDWECLLHSMTARYIDNSFIVNGLDSEFAHSLLQDAVYSGTNGLGYSTTTCYDTATKKNYKVKPDKTGWDECPLHYAKPCLAESKVSNSRLIINPTYSFEYQVKTWKERADIAKLPYINTLVVWGNSHGSRHVFEDMKYVDTVIAVGDVINTNKVPFRICPNRNPFSLSPKSNGITEHTDLYNVYNKKDYSRLIEIIDDCVDNNGWSILRGHAYEQCYFNGYVSFFSDLYGSDSSECGPLCYKDDSYPSEWTLPLKYEELKDMLGDNVHDYWNNPPERLGISSWGDWYPCPGTSMAMLYDAIEYAINKGITFSKTEDVIRERGNMFALGSETIVTLAPDKRLYREQDIIRPFCRIGADGSINYNNK